ncbi:hypothetical protein LBC_16510 [Campylobacter sp. 19-13652]|nr:hypothetical protein LBC_16510 [Campylobacter sp. 19-13652]
MGALGLGETGGAMGCVMGALGFGETMGLLEPWLGAGAGAGLGV